MFNGLFWLVTVTKQIKKKHCWLCTFTDMRGGVCVCVLASGSSQLASQLKLLKCHCFLTPHQHPSKCFSNLLHAGSLYSGCAPLPATPSFTFMEFHIRASGGISPAVGQVSKTHFTPTLSLKKIQLGHMQVQVLVKRTSTFFRSFACKSLTS